MNQQHFRRNTTSPKHTPTCFTSDSDYRPSSDPHALRVDHRGAEKSCNGAIYCRTSLLQHAPEREGGEGGQDFAEIWPHILCNLLLYICQTAQTSAFSGLKTGMLPWYKFNLCANSWAASQKATLWVLSTVRLHPRNAYLHRDQYGRLVKALGSSRVSSLWMAALRSLSVKVTFIEYQDSKILRRTMEQIVNLTC